MVNGLGPFFSFFFSFFFFLPCSLLPLFSSGFLGF